MTALVSAAALALTPVVAPSPYALLRAEALAYAPYGAPAGDPWPGGRSAVLAVAVRDGALDPEGMSVMFRPVDLWETEVNYVRQNVAAVRRAPPLTDLDWLPPAHEAARVAQFNRAFAATLADRLLWEPDRRGRLGPAAVETARLARVWNMVADVHAYRGWNSPRRLRLALLRDELGEAAWAARELPPAAAWWAFAPSP